MNRRDGMGAAGGAGNWRRAARMEKCKLLGKETAAATPRRRPRRSRSLRARSCFTLVEMLVAMGLFSLIMLVCIGFFDSTQKLVSSTTNRSELYDNAKIALDLMALDLQSICYRNQRNNTIKAAFPYKFTVDNNGINTLMAFISESPVSDSPGLPAEIQYQRDNEGKLQRSVKLDTNFYEAVQNPNGYNFSANSDFRELIRHVNKFKITPLNETGTALGANKFPSMILLELELLSQLDWEKKQAGLPNEALQYQTFIRPVFLGGRGQ